MQRNCYLVIKKIKNRKNSTLYKAKVRKVVIKIGTHPILIECIPS